jgi:hypothetical protein
LNKLILIPILILLSINSTGCNLFGSERSLPIEMVAYNSLTYEEKDLIPVSPKDSIVKQVPVNNEIESLIDNNYDEDQVYSVTFNNTETNTAGNLVIFVDLDKKTVVGKGFASK